MTGDDAVPAIVPDSVTKMLLALQQLVEQVPQLTTEVEVLMEGIHAERLTLQALQAESAAFDSQLALLEKSLGPLQSWTIQWPLVRGTLSDTVGWCGRRTRHRRVVSKNARSRPGLHFLKESSS